MSRIDVNAEGSNHINSRGLDEECTLEGAGGPEDAEAINVGRWRQVIGILALQLGIMIHSPVIGLTGSKFSALSLYSTNIGVLCEMRVESCPDNIRERGERSQLS